MSLLPSRLPRPQSMRRLLAACAAATVVTSVLAHAAPTPLGFDDARHLLARTGFGPTEAEVRSFAALAREEAVDRLLRTTQTAALTPPPAWTFDRGPLRAPRGDTASEEERRAFRQQQVRHGLELRAWWMREMLTTPSPLTERMTLFWHNHFVSSQQKVRFARLMYAQNVTLRAHAVGNFAAMLHAASKDPAMLVYLDGAQSRKGQPNENFAREVMELFTLGEGQFTERDVKEAARAFTGWSIDRDTGMHRLRPGVHDGGVKTVLGRSGRFDGDGVLDVILADPRTARFVTAKLWREFVSADPDPHEVERIALILRGRDYDLKAALRALLLSDAFWATQNRGTLVKSPTELVIGTLRQLEVVQGPEVALAVTAAGMGQNLFAPPNVKGWPGGESWINSNTLLARKQFLDRLATANEADGAPLAIAMAGESGDGDEQVARNPAAMAATLSAAATLPASAVDERALRAQRFARRVDRDVRNVRFDAAAWIARREGATAGARLGVAQALLLPLPPVADAAPIVEANANSNSNFDSHSNAKSDGADARAFVRATLLDPAFQLK